MVYLRKAKQSDIDLLYQWANDPVVRENSFNSMLIPYDVHKRWFEHMMSDENTLQFILMNDDIPIGQIRLNIAENNREEAEIGYSIASDYRGQGFGHQILQLIMDEIYTNYPQIIFLIAKVKPENIASKKLFESEGYKMKYSCYSLDTKWGGVLRSKD